MASFSHLQSQMQSQGLTVPPKPLVGPGPSGPRVSTKGSCVDPSGNDPETGDSDRCGLYIEADPARLVAIGRVYEGSTVVHNTPLLPGQVKVSVEEVRDAYAPVPVPTDEVAVSPPKPPPKPDPEVDDPLYLMTLTIPELFLRPYQVRWDATVFGVVNPGQTTTLRGLLIVLSRVLMMLHSLNQRLLLGELSSRYCNRQKGTTECGYYVMHWMSTIILGTFRNNWEAYFNDPRPLEPERLKALRIQWAQFYLRIRDQA
ncbi:hypothetical protein HKD37_18G051089 [Glycine soja]